MKRIIIAISILITCTQYAVSQDEVNTYVIDVGAGLCTLTIMPGPHYMIYDTGDYMDDGQSCLNAIKKLVPTGTTIDLMVLSHPDSDHLGGADELLESYTVKRILRTGMERWNIGHWRRSNEAINKERIYENALDINLQYFEFLPGSTYKFGDSFLTMITGFGRPQESWGFNQGSEYRNSLSIVMKLTYHNKSILFAGDAVGRHIGDPPDALIATEKFMVDNHPIISIASDVLIAPHHGADNGSSTDFIKAVSPEIVIFSAGHKHRHPRAVAVQRYISLGVDIDKIFRTDLGDDEDDIQEWNHGEIDGETDGREDDDVKIVLTRDGNVTVEYFDIN